MQTVLPVIMAITFPGSDKYSREESGESSEKREEGIRALVRPEFRWSVLAPLLAITMTGLVNWVIIEPVVVGIMKERKHQGKAVAMFGEFLVLRSF